MLTTNIKNRLFNKLAENYDFLGNYKKNDGILIFLSRIWDLKNMEAEDKRFRNAYDDAQQHLINNNDWDLDQTFLIRFKLIESDNKYFISFIETVVHPTVRQSLEDIENYVKLINSFLAGDNFLLRIADYFEELPIYKYTDVSEDKHLSNKIQNNTVPVYFNIASTKITYPSFRIWADQWDDFGSKTMFDINYYTTSIDFIKLGRIKIMRKETNITSEVLPDSFFDLDPLFCSMGVSEYYYKELKKILGKEYNSFLLGMRDVAMFPKFYEDAKDDRVFQASFQRNNSLEQLRRTIRYVVEGINPNEYFKFSYTYKSINSDDPLILNFDFEYNNDFEHRIYALIGKNGTGKTSILSQLALDMSNKISKKFSPHKPVYGNLFTVSYSYFDKFQIPEPHDSFSYVYCGLKKQNGTLKTFEELHNEFFDDVDKIKTRDFNEFIQTPDLKELDIDLFDNKYEETRQNFEDIWISILKNFISKEVLSTFKSTHNANVSGPNKNLIDRTIFATNKVKLSSGESVLLFMLTKIIAEIRYDSLILFDEPETHLHPNAVNSLINALFELVKEFKSFCIIATHSPLIIQEISARNIFVIMKEENNVYVNRLEHESFGENLTIITEDIFGKNPAPKHFITLIKELLKKNKTYEEIIALFKSASLPITSNIRLHIKALINNPDNEGT